MACLALSLTSCTEKEEIGEFHNWEARNVAFIDSIAKVCDANVDGKWMRVCAFNLDSVAESQAHNNLHYVYIHKEGDGQGTYTPWFNDSIRVHYLGRLIPTASYNEGYVFGKSYSTYTLNEATDVPAIMAVNQNVIGFATAAMRMKEGDSWRLYIPYYLGYGTSQGASTSIPGYSTLIFDVKMVKIYKFKEDTNTGWR